MDLQFEKKKLYDYLGEDLVDALKHFKVYIAGGTITSLFTNNEINDIDIYFRDEDSIINFLREIWENGRYVVSNTKKATQILYENINIQTIHFNYFDSPKEIFDTFDFTVCMGAFDFATEQFVFHPDFLKHNSQRILKFNSETAFPIVSLLRVQKYENKGYKISKPEFIRIALTCMDLDINTYDELKEQLGGMYGVNLDKLFEDVEEEEFNLPDAIDKIANITLNDDYFVKPTPVEFNDLDDILDTISKKPKKYLNINEKHYVIDYNGLLKEIYHVPEYKEDVNIVEFFKENKFYKFVKKVGEKYFSFYDNEFEYIIGEEIAAKFANGYGKGNGQLYLFEKNQFNSQYQHNRDSVLIEVEVKPEDFIDADEGDVEAKKVTVIREVPKDEWIKWESESEKF
ncbi:hypothetical protein [Robertmurraya siralis]|uniref:hypothetical protein n=1 Tax=Robertmurraya siralis TaxID=77777 RepID=UPI0010F93E34|nr:hypothetical protein [Robertmurraya siralis]